MKKCNTCPVSGLKCLAQIMQSSRYCDYANPEHPSFNESIYNLVVNESDRVGEPDTTIDNRLRVFSHEQLELDDSRAVQVADKDSDIEVASGVIKYKNDYIAVAGGVDLTTQLLSLLHEIEFPSLIERAKNFAGALYTHIAAGDDATSENVANARLDLCNKCKFLTAKRECSKCGCYVDRKVTWKSSECPAGYWGVSTDNKKTAPEGGCGCDG